MVVMFISGSTSLTAIQGLYTKLVENDQLFLPAQAVREFLDNRSSKLSDMNDSLSKKISQSYQYVGPHPLLSELVEFKDLESKETILRQAMQDYHKEIKKVRGVIQSWGWDDPVSHMYHEVLKDRVLEDDIDQKKVGDELTRRNTLKIPPGYKDSGKNQNNAGDLLIWHEILNLAETKKNHLIFVSGDEKQDWWHQSNKEALYPRIELVDEYREKSNGKSFHIISLSTLLKLFGTEPEVVDAVKSSESMKKINLTLFNSTMSLVKKVREELVKYRLASDMSSDERMKSMSSAVDEERDLIWQKFNHLDSQIARQLMDSYDSNYKIDAIVFRDKIISTLQEDVIEEDRLRHRYQYPTNPLGITSVIDNLEYLAKQLA